MRLKQGEVYISLCSGGRWLGFCGWGLVQFSVLLSLAHPVLDGCLPQLLCISVYKRRESSWNQAEATYACCLLRVFKMPHGTHTCLRHGLNAQCLVLREKSGLGWLLTRKERLWTMTSFCFINSICMYIFMSTHTNFNVIKVNNIFPITEK